MTGSAGEHGAQFNRLFGLFLGVTGAFYVLVVAGLVLALIHWRRRGGEDGARVAERGLIFWLGAVLLGLTGLTLASFVADRNVAAAMPSGARLRVELTANQWWWDVIYSNGNPGERMRTANELHLPADVPVELVLKSKDVIHSFWVPALAGKQDMIPGRTNTLTVLARRVGRWRGQCAEFCGTQHAHMALDVTIEPPGKFAAWWRAGLAPAATPSSALAQAGYDYVTSRECANCHTIAGTPATGTLGPDLTHFASRASIGAGTFPLTRGHLYGWVADPQGAKAGVNMPTIGLDAQNLHAVVAYLEGLK